jgi:hypothetical protein
VSSIITKIPKLLFRGDSDKQNFRKIKETFNSGVLLTSLSSGGVGKIIFKQPLNELIVKHIGVGWNKTHFLSFSSNKDIALKYGSDKENIEEVYNDNENWDFLLFTFSTELLIKEKIIEVSTGVYKAEFHPNCKEFLPTFTIILINCYDYLSHITEGNKLNFKKEINNAKKDSEWLILPANLMRNGFELTSKLDDACIIGKQKYKSME